MASLSPIDDRLLSTWEHRQIEIVGRCDMIAAAVGRLVDRARNAMVAEVVGAAADYNTFRRIERIYRGIIPELVAYLNTVLPGLVRYSDNDARRRLARTVPRRWWKVKFPGLIEAAPAGRDPLDKLFGPKNFSIGAEPAIKGKVSSDEFRRLLDEMLLPPLTETQVEEIVKSPNPHTGDPWEKRLTDLSSKVTQPERVAGEIITGMATGEDVKSLRDRIDKHVGKLHGSSMRIARTEARRVAETANREALKQSLGDLLDGWQITAVLDERTRPEHAARHGTVYRKGGQPAFEDAPETPDAPNCRCTLVPVLKTPDEIANDPAVAQAFANASGGRIPDPVAYDDWFRQADERRRRIAVGSRRYDLVKAQKPAGVAPEWSDFIGSDGKLIPTKTLKAGPSAERKGEVMAMLAQRRSDFLAITQSPFIPTPIRPLPSPVAAVVSLTGQQQRQMKRLAKRIVAGEIPKPDEQIRLARAIAPGKTDAELRQLIDLAIAGFFGGR